MDFSEKLKGKKPCDTGLAEQLNLLDGNREPWHCDFCGFFVYNLDVAGRPREGAPIARYHDTKHQNVCAVCHALVNNARFETNYWKELHRIWKEQQEKYGKNNDKLRPGGEYFA